MQYLDDLEGLRSQGFPNEEVAVRRHEIMQPFIDGVRNFELKRNIALMYAQEKYAEEPHTVEALRITMQQHLRMRGSARTDHFLPALQPPAPLQNQPNQVQQPIAPPPVPKAQQVPPRPVTYRQQHQRACFNCGDPSHFVIDCPLKDKARKPIPQQVNSCHTSPSGR